MAQHKMLKLSTLLAAATVSTLSYGAGFAIIEQSVTGMGRSFAGSAAVAEDASTIFFNPAGLTNLDKAEIDVGLSIIIPDAQFKDNGSSSPFGAPLSGNGGETDEIGAVPSFYISMPLNDRMVIGLGVGAPFGLVTEYDDDWQGRYHAVKSDMKTMNINPTFAFKATDKLSLGFGFNAQKIDLELTQMADLGAAGGAAAAIAGGITDPAIIGAIAAANSQTADGKVKLEADDWSYGYNLGLTYQLQQATRLGIAYRSKISHTLEGDGTLETSTGTVIANEKIQGDVDLPETLSFALHHQLNDKWAIMGDATWTRWSRFQELAIESDGILNSVKDENWDNSMRYGLGLSYDHNDKWTFRSGVAYDETPVPDAQHRTARIPDNDRTWLSFGASYQATENIVIDAAYSHLFISDAKINETDDNGYNLSGEYESSVDILAVQMRWMY